MWRRGLAITLLILLSRCGVLESGDIAGGTVAILEEQRPESSQSGYSIKVNVESAFLNVAVRDRKTNRRLAGLKKEDFLVYEDGKLQQIEQFIPSEAPIDLLLLLDVSGSTGLFLDLMKQATIDFVHKVKANDRMAIVAFSSRVDLLTNFTDDRTKAERAIKRIWAGGGTAFFDALMACVDEYMRGIVKRSAIVVFTDGIDNQLEGGFPAGSRTTFDELYRKIQESEPAIYTIFLDTVGRGPAGSFEKEAPSGLDSRYDRNPKLAPSLSNPKPGDTLSPEPFEVAVKQLKMITDQTGGRMFSPRKIEELSGIYSEIAGDLAIQYQLGYNPTNSTRDGRWRKIEVKIQGYPEAVVRTRKGYFAAKEGDR
jgi:Ca-activated chloride channel homolog